MNEQINIVTWNARGIRNKKEELYEFLLNNNIDICLLNETWLNQNVSIRHNEFYCYRNDRVGGRGGGVAIIIKKNIRHQLMPLMNTSLIENIGVKIFNSNGDSIDIYSCYFPGGNTRSTDNKKQKFTSDLRKLSSSSNNYLLGGDFNSRHSMWGCSRANCWGNLLHDKLPNYNIQLVIPNEHTYISSSTGRQNSTLDIFLTNAINNFSEATVINDLSSDHLPVKLTFKKLADNNLHRIFDYKRANWTRFSHIINSHITPVNIESVSRQEQIDEMIEYLTNIIKLAKEQTIPLKSSQIMRRPLPANIKYLILVRNRSRRNWIRYRTSSDLAIMKMVNSRIQEEITKFRNISWNSFFYHL